MTNASFNGLTGKIDFNAQTMVWSNSFWTGFHGCVKVKFFAADDTLIGESREQRWGVDAERSRHLSWSGAVSVSRNPPPLLRYRFAQRRC